MSQLEPINLVLPPPPALNRLYVNMVLPAKWPSKKPRAMKWLSNEGIAYKRTVEKEAQRLKIVPFVGEVGVTIKWFRPRRIGDLDGIFKIILDSLTGFAYIDDKQIKRLLAERFEDKENPRVEIEISAMGLC